MTTRKLEAQTLDKLSQVVETRIETTFQEVINRKLSMNPSWLFAIFNEFTKVRRNFGGSIRERKARLLQLTKKLFVETAVHLDIETALVVNKRVCLIPTAA